jgi:hypothetical protein
MRNKMGIGSNFVSKRTITELDIHNGEVYKYHGSIGDILYFFRISSDKIIPVGVPYDNSCDYFYTEKEVRLLKLKKLD